MAVKSTRMLSVSSSSSNSSTVAVAATVVVVVMVMTVAVTTNNISGFNFLGAEGEGRWKEGIENQNSKSYSLLHRFTD
jgi:hypothetical protein